MKIQILLFVYIFSFLLQLVRAGDHINCTESRLHAVYYATRCCSLTFPKNDPEFTECHLKYSEMTNKPAQKLISKERIAINICAHECSLLEKGFIKEKYRNEFDTDAIEDYYLELYQNNEIYSTFMLDAFLKCLKFDSSGEVNIKFPKTDFISEVCDPRAARIMMCVRTKAIQTCPESAFSDKSVDCIASKLYFKECIGSIEKVVRNMD